MHGSPMSAPGAATGNAERFRAPLPFRTPEKYLDRDGVCAGYTASHATAATNERRGSNQGPQEPTLWGGAQTLRAHFDTGARMHTQRATSTYTKMKQRTQYREAMPTPRDGPVCHGRKAFAGEGGEGEGEGMADHSRVVCPRQGLEATGAGQLDCLEVTGVNR